MVEKSSGSAEGSSHGSHKELSYLRNHGRKKTKMQEIIDGIVLRHENTDRLFGVMSYGKIGTWNHFQEADEDYLLSEGDVMSEHILLLREMKPDIISSYEKHRQRKYVKGIIYINTTEDYELPEHELDELVTDIPVCILKVSAGQRMLQALTEKNVFCTIQSTSSTSVDESPEEYDFVYPENVIASDPQQIKDLLYPKVRQSNGFMSRIPVNPGPGENLELFRIVMDLAMQFKNMDSSTLETLLREKISVKIERYHLMEKDFPFYVAFIGCINTFWKSVDKDTLISACIKEVEKIETSALILVLKEFLGRGNFFIDYVKSISAFTLLYKGCLVMLYRSQDLYCNILWTSFALTVNSKDEGNVLSNEDAEKLWNDRVYEECKRMRFDENNLKIAQKGIKLIRSLDKPLSDILPCIVSGMFTVSKLPLLKDVCGMLATLFDVGGVSEAAGYSNYFRIEYFKAGSAVKPASIEAIKYGMKILFKLEEEYKHREAKYEDFLMKEFNSWIEDLVKLALLDTSSSRIIALKEMVSKPAEMQTNKVKKEVVRQIKSLVSEEKLNMKDFSPLFANFFYWDDQFIQHYLENYPLSKFGCILNESHWNSFLQNYTERYKDAEYHRCVLAFFYECVRTYNKNISFFFDLLKLNTKRLFKTSRSQDTVKQLKEEFKIFMANDVLRCVDVIELNMKDILNLASKDQENYFHELLLSGLQTEIISEYIKKKNDKRVHSALRSLSEEVSYSTGPSVKSKFCSETVDSVYNHIPTFRIGTDMKLFGGIVLSTATIVHSNYFIWYSLNEPESMLVTKSQQFDSSAYFMWVTKYLKDILTWKKKLEAEIVSYNELREYQRISDFTEGLLKAMIPENALTSFSCSKKSLQEAKDKFNCLFNELYGHLIIGIISEGKKLTGYLVLLLNEYYVTFPAELMEKVECSLDKPLTKILTRESIVFKTDCTLHDLDSLLKSLTRFTAPIEKNLKLFIFFEVHQSSLFHFHLKSHLCHGNKITIQCFNEALVNTRKILVSIIDGTISYNILTGNGQLDLHSMNIEQEFKILQLAAEDRIVRGCNQNHLIELKNLLQLFKLAHHIQCLHDIFEKYQLKVISDRDFMKCYEDSAPYRDEKQKVTLKLSDTGSKLNEIKRMLCMPIERKSESLDVLLDIKESPELFKFIIDKEFYGDAGLELFRKQYQLITIQLQHMEYDEKVLNNLRAAIKITAPFCLIRVSESTDAFKRLMQSINDNLCGSNELQIINKNMSLVQRWFSHANEENIYELLKDIMKNGRFEFDVPPFSLVFTTSGDFQSPLERKWMPEDVNDFATAIQFYEKENQFDANIFKNSLKVAYKIMEMSHEALHLGGTLELSPLYCNTSIEATNDRVQDMILKLQQFTSEVARYQREYPWLLLLSIPKTILVSNLLKESKTSTFNIACEMIYLAKKDLKWEEMELQVEKNYSTVKGEIDCLKSPIERVGIFLNRSREVYIDPQKNSFADDQIYIKLCFGFGYTQHQLMSIICYIYEDRAVIQPHQIFICDSKTTEENLEQLFKRAKVFIDTYTIIGVNFLNFKLQEILVEHLTQYYKYSSDHCVSVIYLIETKPSNIRDISWVYEFVDMKDVKDLHDGIKLSEYYVHHHTDYLNAATFYVMGNAGDGKTHFICNEINNDLHDYVVISIDESFSVFKTISRLRKLYERSNAKERVGIFFNFTLFKVKDDYGKMVSTALGWFFFNLLVLGYVEDDATGYSFSLLKGINWKIYIEAPPANSVSREDFINLIPILDYVTAPIDIRDVYDINLEAQLVCKYLHAYSMKASDTRQAKKLRKMLPSRISEHDDLTIKECNELMLKYMPDHQSIYSKKLFMQYMYKKCRFLDDLQFTNSSRELRDLLMDIILSAVKAFTLSNICVGIENQSWSSSIKYQIVCNKYKKQDDNSMFIMCTDPDYITDNLKEKISVMETQTGKLKERFKIVIPKKKSEFKSLNYLLQCLSHGFGIDIKDCESLLKESQYVLTADYTMKMLNINECMECKLPVIICGETGVGKTFLIEMISKMWNLSLRRNIEEKQSDLMDSITCTDQLGWKDIARKFKENRHLDEEEVISVMKKSDLTQLNELILSELASNSLWSLLDMPFSVEEYKEKKLHFSLEDYGKLILSLLTSVPKRTFYKLSVHSALTSDYIDSFFEDKIQISKKVSDSSAQLNCDHDIPSVTVLIDEINTSSCGGRLKEIIADKKFHGVELPKNLFVIATCNPHRGNSLIIGSDPSDISLPKMTYFVHDLHPTLKLLMWNFGSLSDNEERDYVFSKLNLVMELKSDVLTSHFTHLITLSQQLIRNFTSSYIFDHCLTKQGDAEDLAKGSVSQRDIQRVFSFYFWLLKVYKMRRNVDDPEHRAILVSLGLVYYLRLNSDYRKLYASKIDRCSYFSKGISFSKAFEYDIEWLLSNLIIPKGIAKTRALKENLFAIIVCTCNKVPIIVVGKPGTSKTLSFNLAIENLKGIDSHNELLRNTELFPALDPILYQCSKQTTSYEIDTLFTRAVNRQRTYSGGITCVVFMDEAGLPEERHESLKILHHHLDERNVAFVGISNHILDAAKTNRAVSIVIPDSSEEDLRILVKGCYDNDSVTSEVIKFCPAYLEIIQDQKWRNVFGMRDFIYFIHYLCKQKQELTPTLVLHALERNFNGTPDFKDICKVFFQHYPADECNIRNTFDTLKESIREKWDSTKGYGRYKLIFDASEDDSVISFFFKYGILNEQKTHIYISSKLFTEKELQKVNTISAICHSVSKGHTVIMYQTEDIHECFYDLFNLRFRCIEDSSGCRYYTNVAIGGHIKPIWVHPDFQCIVVLKQSTFQTVPTPFLNRFEKYMINHKIILWSVLEKYPKGVQHVVNIALKQIKEFVSTIGGSATLYGFRNMSVYSVILLMLPSKLNPYKRKETLHQLFHDDKELFCHVEILKALNQIGIDLIQFHPCIEELKNDASNIFSLLNQNPTFSELYQKIDSPETVYEYIMLAMEVLMSSSDEYPLAIVTGVHLILSYIIQLIIRSLCKCLMQVMTPEGLIIVRKNIPSSYLHSYLYYQDHFSLKGIIEQEVDLLQMNIIYGSDADAFMNMQKIQKYIIFCRSSAMIHSLPSNFPSMIHSLPSDFPSLGNKQTHIISDVAVIKVSVIHSQDSFKKEIDLFYKDNILKVLLLIIDVQESSPEMINHIRMIVDEAQPIDSEVTKKVVLLLHFPSSMFSSGYYPTLFLHGWKYRYIDSLAHSAESGDLDMELLIKNCLVKNLDDSMDPVYDYHSLLSILHHSAENISPLLTAYFKSNKYITKTDIRYVLTDEDTIAMICKRFLHYLDAGRCLQYLDNAAKAAYERESTINMKSHIEVRIKNNMFKNFLIYVITFFHVHGVTKSLLAVNQATESLERFIRDLLPSIPVPDIFQLTNGSSYYSSVACNECSYECPFFLHIYDGIEKIMDEAMQIVRDENVQFQFSNSFSILKKRKMELFSIAIHKLKQDIEIGENFFAIAISKMDEDVIWQRYFHDFFQEKLNFPIKTSGYLHDLMFALLLKESAQERERCLSEKDWIAVYKVPFLIVSLHFQFQIKRSFFKTHSTILKLLNEIDLLSGNEFSKRQLTPNELMKNLCQCALDILFSFFCQPLETITVKHLELWNSVYLILISDSKLVEKLYKMQLSTDQAVLTEKKWNIMHAMHSVFSSCSSDHLFNATTIILKCYSSFIRMLRMDSESQLKSIHEVLSEVLQEDNKYLIKNKIYDKMFEHFFSKSRSYNYKDIQCFLRISNESDVHISRSVTAYYLRRLLKSEGNDQMQSFHYKSVRKEIGVSVALHYESTVSQTKLCNTEILQIPVGYLYHVLHMEELLATDRNIVSLLDREKSLIEEFKSQQAKFEKVLLNIEIQSTIQVIIRTIAEKLSGNDKPNVYTVMYQLGSYYGDIRAIFEYNEEYTDTLTMHMLEENKSLKIFEQNNNILCEEKILSNRDLNSTIKAPFVMSLYESRSSKEYYNDMKLALVAIADSRSNDCSKDLEKLTILKKRSLKLKIGNRGEIKGEPLFYMTLWLCVHKEFNDKNVSQKKSEILLQKLAGYVDDKTISLLKTLLDPDTEHFLFQPRDYNKEDEMHRSMQRNVVVMIAVLLGLQPKSNNLWFHLFEPLELMNTFIPGFLSDRCLTEDMPYSSGCQLSSVGLYSNYYQYIASKNRNMRPQHIFIILWMNISSLSMCFLSGLISREEMQSIIGSHSGINIFFEQQLNLLWTSMQRYFGLLHEEIDYLLVSVMQKYLEFHSSNEDAVIFKDEESRQRYESIIVQDVIMTGIEGFMNNLPFNSLEVNKSREIECNHVRFLSVTDVQYIAASLADNFASDFLFGFYVLNIISESLNSLIEFYELIHKDLSYRITKDLAEELSIDNLQHQLKDHFPSDEVKNFKQMFKECMVCSKKFIEVTGDEESKKFILDGNSKVISLLSTDREEGDYLFKMINKMITFNNTILVDLCGRTGGNPSYHNLRSANSLEMEDLVQRCSLMVKKVRKHPFSIEWREECIDYSQLKSDIDSCMRERCLLYYNVRYPFKFRSTTAIDIDNIILEMDTICYNLPAKFRIELTNDLASKLRSLFHRTEFAVLKDILTGLLVIGRNLSIDHSGVKSTEQDLKQYVEKYLGDDVFSSLSSNTSSCITELIRHKFSEDQLKCLEKIEIGMLFSLIKYFCTWIKEGYCDFCDINLCFKNPLDRKDDEILKNIIYTEHYIEQPKELLKDLTRLESAVINLRSILLQRYSENEEPLITLIKQNIGDCDLLDHVPKSIVSKHYVSFHIAIRKLINSTKRVIERKSNDDNSPKIWNEWIKNPWAGVYTIQYDEPVAVKEHFMKDTEESVSIKQFHGGDDDDSSSAGSVPEHLSDFEFSDTESIAEPEYMDKPLEDFTSEDLSDYFVSMGMTRYVDLIESGSILDGNDISEMNINDLKEAGVRSKLDQLKIFLYIKNMKLEGRFTSTSKAQVQPVLQFLHSSNSPDFKKYVPSFRKHGITGEILLGCNVSILNEIGVESVLDASRIIVYFRKYFEGDEYDHEISKEKLLSGIRLRIGSLQKKDDLLQGKDDLFKKIEENDVSLHMLREGGKELLNEIGIESKKVQVLFRQLKKIMK